MRVQVLGWFPPPIRVMTRDSGSASLRLASRGSAKLALMTLPYAIVLSAERELRVSPRCARRCRSETPTGRNAHDRVLLHTPPVMKNAGVLRVRGVESARAIPG